MVVRRHRTVPADRTALTALAAVGFIATVALVGAGSVGPRRRGGSSAADTAVTTIAVLVGVAALGCTLFVVLRTRRPPPPAGEPTGSVPPFLLRPLLTPLVATLLLLLFSVLVIGPCLSDQRSSEVRPERPRRPSAVTVPRATRGRPGHDTPDWSVVTGFVLGAAGLALAATAARNRRRPDSAPDQPMLDDEIAQSLADLDGLEQDPDHRRVVIRTYARMERALGQTAGARQPWETPQEFLRRTLASLGAGAEAARRLTELFELARFSSHPVDAGMRAEAAASLRAVRDDIAIHRTSTGTTA